jgi:tetratricopeptide (TPR) repeat protein
MTFARGCASVGSVRIHGLLALTAGLLLAAATPAAEQDMSSIWQRRWFEARTLHFQTYSCGATQEVARLAGRLEQFREAYARLAGADAVSSPPILVVAFPDHKAMAPFLPLYEGQPANLAGFFARGSDENLIVLSLGGSGTGSLPIIYHEFAHALLRHNERFWPMWLKEGMADIYSTFEVTGNRSARIGQPVTRYLGLLHEKPLMPLKQLFAVERDSPEYNERERQGVFYAESWLLAHYLMLGGNADHKARFGQLTVLLRQGQSPESAFINTFRVSLPTMEAELRAYLKRNQFASVTLPVQANLLAPQAIGCRGLTPTETCFRLGDELLRVGRPEAAEPYFARVGKLAPKSPLGAEGPGLLAAERGQHAEAVAYLRTAIQRGSTSFLAHYLYAREKYQLTEKSPNTFSTLRGPEAVEIRGELLKAIQLMPNFAPAHHLLGFFELVQGEDLKAAGQHLQRAVELEPENQSYVLTLAQAQLSTPEEARRTLEPLRLPYVEAKVRAQAEVMLKEIGAGEGRGASERGALKR